VSIYEHGGGFPRVYSDRRWHRRVARLLTTPSFIPLIFFDGRRWRRGILTLTQRWVLCGPRRVMATTRHIRFVPLIFLASATSQFRGPRVSHSGGKKKSRVPFLWLYMPIHLLLIANWTGAALTHVQFWLTILNREHLNNSMG
jgi:hypothetical protein